MTGSLILDPREFITPPFETCPACGAENEFGVLSVFGRSYVKRCRSCWATEQFDLPPLSKELIYLDQVAVSHLAKSIHPDWRERYGPGNPQTQDGFWLAAFERLDRLRGLELACCPESGVQRMESVLNDRLRDILRTLYERLAGELRFHDVNTVQDFQIAQAFRAFLVDEPFDLGDREGMLSNGDPSAWTRDLQLSVDMRMHEMEAEEARRIKAQRAPQLEFLFDEARAEPGRSYDSFRDEYVATPEGLLRGWQYSGLTSTFERGFEEQGIAADEQVAKLQDFAHSDQLRSIPAFRLKMCLFAAFAAEVSGGRAARPNPSMWFDFQGISSYLPYCDAIFADRQCQRFLDVISAAGDLPWSTRVFSIEACAGFLSYLDGIEAAASPKHIELVKKVYGDRAGEPFKTLYEWRGVNESRSP